jgi:Ion channel
MEHLTNTNNWVVVIATLLVVALCVGLHYEVLSNISRFLGIVSHRPRRRVLILIMLILITHVAEIWLFGFAYYFLADLEDLGALIGTNIETLPEYTYYSATVYTTVGFGDLVPTGAIRFMTGMEALTGLVMITWSASLTFLVMQRDWPPKR